MDIFDYSRVPFLLWENQLRLGDGPVSLPVLWGVHESSPGIRDFSRSSRLKIEKVLSLAALLGRKIEISVGFPPRRESFPEWSWANGVDAIIPQGVWDGFTEGASLTSIPSLSSPSLRKAFLGFLSELSSILKLYYAPQGPVESVVFDDLLLSYEESELTRPVQKESVENINRRYQTNLKTLPKEFSAPHLKLLIERRPWLAAFDLKANREVHLNGLLKEIREIFSGINFSRVTVPEDPVQGGWSIVLEDTCVQWDRSGIFPFCPLPEGSSPYWVSYQSSTYWRERARSAGIRCGPLSKYAGADKKLLVVICGKYITRVAMNILMEKAASGDQIFFPSGKPIYDEDLNPFVFPAIAGVCSDDKRVQLYQFKKGKIWIAQPEFLGVTEKFEKVKFFSEKLLDEESR